MLLTQVFQRRGRIGVVTVRQLEAGATEPRRVTLEGIRRAFEMARIELIDENGGGPALRYENVNGREYPKTNLAIDTPGLSLTFANILADGRAKCLENVITQLTIPRIAYAPVRISPAWRQSEGRRAKVIPTIRHFAPSAAARIRRSRLFNVSAKASARMVIQSKWPPTTSNSS